MRVAIEKDEWYPVYSIQDNPNLISEYERVYEVPQNVIDEYWEAMTRFTDIQMKLRLIIGDRNG